MNRLLDDWLTYIGRVHVRDIELGLDRVAEVARRLDVVRPAESTVIVAGTNGKGSTCVALEQLLIGEERRVGTTLSPHVTHFNERIRIDGRELADDRVCRLFEEVDGARGELPLTYFEFVTLAALELFSRTPLDAWLLEVGLGGRLDAVNVVDADLALIGPVDLDHAAWLGTDREAIGQEKAGIMRSGRPVVCVDDDPPQSLVAHAAAVSAPLFLRDRDFHHRTDAQGWQWWCADRRRSGGGCLQQ